MNDIEIFKHEKFGGSRFIREGDSFSVVAKDVVEGVGVQWKGVSGSIAHVPEQWRGARSVQTPRGIQKMAVLTEQGLYFYLGRCDKPTALPYQMWIAGEVVPSIRKRGEYAPSRPPQIPVDTDALIAMVKRLELAEERVDAFRPKVTYGTISKITGLPRTNLVSATFRSFRRQIMRKLDEFQMRLFDFQ